MDSTVNILVTVSENGIEVDEANITYFEGQPYRVELVTPDGTDLLLPMGGFYNAGVRQARDVDIQP